MPSPARLPPHTFGLARLSPREGRCFHPADLVFGPTPAYRGFRKTAVSLPALSPASALRLMWTVRLTP